MKNCINRFGKASEIKCSLAAFCDGDLVSNSCGSKTVHIDTNGDARAVTQPVRELLTMRIV